MGAAVLLGGRDPSQVEFDAGVGVGLGRDTDDRRVGRIRRPRGAGGVEAADGRRVDEGGGHAAQEVATV